MPQIIGILLWALVPGFIARSKGRSFWGYFFLSLLITPLITMIITLCLSNLKKQCQESQIQNESPKTKICKCGKCNTQREDNGEPCSVCGSTMKIFEYIESNVVSTYKCGDCGNVGDFTGNCPMCGSSNKFLVNNEPNIIQTKESIDEKKEICELCEKPTDELKLCVIKDSLGTRYRRLCNECIIKYNAVEVKNSKSSVEFENKNNDCDCDDSSFCKHCGAKLVDGAVFCNKCGTKVK